MEEEEINNEIERENQSRSIKLDVAIRCAKSAIILSSLKQHHFLSSDKSTITQDDADADDDSEVEKLKKELVKERLKNKKIRRCRFYEFFLQIAVLFSLWTLALFIAFDLFN